MSDLIDKIDAHATDLVSTSQLYNQLLSHRFRNREVRECMKILTERLGTSLQEFATTEEKLTVPAFLDLRSALDKLSSWKSIPSYLDRYRVQSAIEDASATLQKALQEHRSTLADLKALEVVCATGEQKLKAKVEGLRENAGAKLVLGGAAWVAGGLLAPFTGGWSLLACMGGGAVIGDTAGGLWASEIIGSELLGKGLPKFMNLLGANIEIMDALTGLIEVLAGDAKDVSSPGGKVQLLKVRRKAAALSEALQRYVDLTTPAIKLLHST